MLEIYQLLLERVQNDNDLLVHVGLQLLTLKRPEGSLAAFERVLDAEPANYNAAFGAGTAALSSGDRKASGRFFGRALANLPEDVSLKIEAAQTLKGLVPDEVCKLILGGAIVAAWDDADLLCSVGTTARALMDGDSAIKALKRTVELEPGHAQGRAALLDVSLSVCEWGASEGLMRNILAEVRATIESGRPLAIDVWNLFAVGADYGEVARAARYKSRQLSDRLAEARARADFRFKRHRSPRIRLGYLCPYSWRSSHIANLFTVISRHDRSRFELFGYTIQPWKEDDYDRDFRALFDQFRCTPVADPLGSAKQIHRDGIDILIDTTGHFASHCMDLAAMRPAPIVVHGCAGYNIIGGAEFYDYSLNDTKYLPERFGDLYVEKLVHMPHAAMPAELHPISGEAFERRHFELPEDRFIFVDFNHPCKFDPKVFGAWMAILRQVPDSILLLCDWLDGPSSNLSRFAEREEVAPERLLFTRVIQREYHLRRLQLCDLVLDTFYHCGGVTTIDCLNAGLPIVTSVPDRDLPLANLSLLSAIGCEDLVVSDLDAYIEKAVALAKAPEALSEVRRRLWQRRITHPLFQADRWVRNLERGFEPMYENHLAGHALDHFQILDVEDWPGGVVPCVSENKR